MGLRYSMHGSLLRRICSRALTVAGESPVCRLEPLAVALRRGSMNVDLWG